MIGTLSLAGWMLGLYYALRAGGPVGIFRALRDPNVPTWTKVLLALCALPIPGQADELLAAYLLRRIAAERS